MNYWIVKGHNRGKGWANDWQESLTPGFKWRWKTRRHSRVRQLESGDRVFFWECAPGNRFVGLGRIGTPFLEINKQGQSVFEIETLTRYLKKTLAKPDLVKMPELRDASFLKHGQGDAFLAVRPGEARAIFTRLVQLNPELRTLWPDLLSTGITQKLPALDALGEDEFEATEGGTKLSEHYRRERNRKLVKLKKEEVLRREGHLKCEVCRFDFETFYGSVGQGFCEVHHLTPLAELKEGTPTKLGDLAIVCANCHRMLHRSNPPMTLQQLRNMLRQ
jgi:hypothetical protein